MSRFKRNLRLVFAALPAAPGEAWDERRRYVARALRAGPGWRVFDRKDQRFLPDREVAKIDPDELMETTQ